MYFKTLLVAIAILFSQTIRADLAPVSIGDNISAAKFNELINELNNVPDHSMVINNLQNSVNTLSQSPIVAKVSGNSAQQAANAPTMTQLNFDSELWDSRNAMTVAGDFTAPEPGYYSVKSTVWFALNSVNGVSYLAIYVNGSSVSNGHVYTNPSDRMGAHVADDIFLNQNDVVTIWIYQGSGQARAMSSRSFSIHKIR